MFKKIFIGVFVFTFLYLFGSYVAYIQQYRIDRKETDALYTCSKNLNEINAVLEQYWNNKGNVLPSNYNSFIEFSNLDPSKFKCPKTGEKYFPLINVLKINGRDPAIARDRVPFEHLTPLFPNEKFNLADKGSSLSTRIIDLFSPIGKGQRGMIVAQPKTGKVVHT